jgi:membrane dipeptidase
MQRGRVKAVLVAAVADGPVLHVRENGTIVATREPWPMELYYATYAQLSRVRTVTNFGRSTIASTPRDLDSAVRRDQPTVVLSVEGGDFLEGQIGGVEYAFSRGVRSIQLVHYRVNEIGDIQTAPPHHGGLSPFGRDVIREMNRLGMVIDVAHLTHDGVRAAVEVTRKPVILSHTIVDMPWARAVTPEHARLVAARGGMIGIWPVNFGYHGLSGYVDHITRMIKVVGVDHVGLGTDMDGIQPASFAGFDDYSEWPTVGAALLARGYSRDDVAKVLGGNFRRVFAEVAAV